MTERKRLAAVLSLAVLLCGAPALAQNTPSMNLEGSDATIFFTNAPECSATSCTGTLQATVSGVLGQSVQNLKFTLNFEVPVLPPSSKSAAPAKKPKKPTLEQQIQALQSQVEAILPPGCLPAQGTGASSDGAYAITFDGQFCVPNAGVEILTGPVSIVSTSAPMPPDYNVPWASGTLAASGNPHCCSSDYVPHLSNGIIVSIVGALGQEYEGP